MHTGDLLGSGRSADVYAIDDDWALRRYRGSQTTAREAAVMTRLFEQGYPVPEVRPVNPETPRELVLRRLAGPTMVEAALQGAITVPEAGALLADLLIRLHAVPAPDAADPERRVLHLDFHPLNVMLTPDGPMVIDWSKAREGHPALDWGMSALILAQVAVTADELAPVADALLAEFLAHSPAGIVLDAARMAEARAIRGEDPNVSPDEVLHLDEAVALVIEHAAKAR